MTETEKASVREHRTPGCSPLELAHRMEKYNPRSESIDKADFGMLEAKN